MLSTLVSVNYVYRFAEFFRPRLNVLQLLLLLSTVGEDTKTMCVLVEDDIPLGGKCITLLYSMQVIPI